MSKNERKFHNLIRKIKIRLFKYPSIEDFSAQQKDAYDFIVNLKENKDWSNREKALFSHLLKIKDKTNRLSSIGQVKSFIFKAINHLTLALVASPIFIYHEHFNSPEFHFTKLLIFALPFIAMFLVFIFPQEIKDNTLQVEKCDDYHIRKTNFSLLLNDYSIDEDLKKALALAPTLSLNINWWDGLDRITKNQIHESVSINDLSNDFLNKNPLKESQISEIKLSAKSNILDRI